MKRTISALIEKDSEGLIRVISLLTRRKFEIESITISACERKFYERLTIVVINSNEEMDQAYQLTKQLQKLLNVVSVEDITCIPSINRELVLIKLQVNIIEKNEILNLSDIFKLKIIDITESTIIIEFTGNSVKVIALQKVLEKYKILELIKTGEIALTRESLIDEPSLQQYDNNHPYLKKTLGILSSNIKSFNNSLLSDDSILHTNYYSDTFSNYE
uniref:Aceohydroxyacid synthase small subunit n=1 Tax=Fucus vesiculosus TaxID=49266 RepID=D1GJI7_FUCVE|nr:aceohydroxyacid synthase small subunit [Fucus vesiculosus]CAX12440.1 aceohydroxyacid synthase small subunit [Fucus vesiculosus]